MSNHSVCAYWKERKETPEECLSNFANFLSKLSLVHPDLAEWYGTAKTRREAELLKVVSTKEWLISYLQRKKSKKNNLSLDAAEILSLWNKFGFSISAILASTSSVVANNVILKGGEKGICEFLFSNDILPHVFELLVSCFSPDLILLQDVNMLCELEKIKSIPNIHERPVEAIYLSKKYPIPTHFPDWVQSVIEYPHGIIIWFSEKCLSEKIEMDVERAIKIHEYLRSLALPCPLSE